MSDVTNQALHQKCEHIERNEMKHAPDQSFSLNDAHTHTQFSQVFFFNSLNLWHNAVAPLSNKLGPIVVRLHLLSFYYDAFDKQEFLSISRLFNEFRAENLLNRVNFSAIISTTSIKIERNSAALCSIVLYWYIRPTPRRPRRWTMCQFMCIVDFSIHQLTISIFFLFSTGSAYKKEWR